MPQNFPEAWNGRVRQLLSTAHEAPFLADIPELEADITEIGEENVIHVALETFAPDVLINNTTYPIEVQEFEDGTKLVTLDKFQTKATRISEDAAIGASYPKIDNATRGHVRQISRSKYKKAMHAIAPATNTNATPILTLPDNYTPEDVYKLLVTMKGKFDDMEVPEDGRRAVLATDHYNALLLSDKRNITKLTDPVTGKITYMIAGFEVFQYVANPYYTAAGAKLPFGSTPGGTDKKASVFYWLDNIGKKTGLTRQYYDKPDTTNQAHRVNYRHYYICLPLQNQAIGAMK
ncbi:hypothetical protein DBR40_09155 [Pedobacter sp. KBW01]|uniref:phage major capsid protein n=1 Tax=Pedobacter sp. KBW01 TaxID=2153364 RepID=UPI000F5912FF|nr:hypothetical protein [Pedobacter sp. KBW01]RQO78107.1 hypothetical protein DBR40_09155 [Pedobacter sp. KBW01]